ncbi:MAG: helix-turn-helix domain-containing protein [Prolixibacteraceae bacterium]
MTNQNPHPDSWKLLVLLLKGIAEKKGISHYKIAEKTGMHQTSVNRFFNLHYKPRLDLFLKIAHSIGVNFFFEDQEDTDIDYNRLMEEAMTELGRRPDKLPGN